jgi:hypothetical protein
VPELSTRACTALLIPVFAALFACRDGGANMGQRAPGDQPGGVTLGLGDIAVGPRGDFVLFKSDRSLAVGWTESGSVERLPVEQPTRLGFSKTRDVVYVGSTASGGALLAIDVRQQEILWSTPVSDATTSALRLMASTNDRYLLSASARTGRISILDPATGAVRNTVDLAKRIVDIQILPDDERAIVVLEHGWEGSQVTTPFVIISLETALKKELEVPNCADRVALSGGGSRAFLAPTTCIEPGSREPADPISVIDLNPGEETFVRNLPGFGPVAVSPEGTTTVGFLDRTVLDLELFDDESLVPDESTARFHLMLIDAETLTYRFVEVGQRLPRFAVTPDGNVLLVDSSFTVDVPARLLDVDSGQWRYINGAPLLLDNFVLTSDSAHAYVIEQRFYPGLYDLDIARGVSEEIPLAFSPRNINISPSDDTLYLRKNDSEICVFSLVSRRCERSLEEPTFVAR